MATPNRIQEIVDGSGEDFNTLVANLLDEHGHSQKRVADALGVSQSALSIRMKRRGWQMEKRWVLPVPVGTSDTERCAS